MGYPMTVSNFGQGGFTLPDYGSNTMESGIGSGTLGSGLYGMDFTNMPITPENKGMFGGMFDGLLGSTDANGLTKQGWGGMALGAAQGIGSLFMGMQQYGLAKEALAENKKQFGMNYAAQRNLTNSSLEDRQRARVASNPGAYQSVGDYMAKNGVAA